MKGYVLLSIGILITISLVNAQCGYSGSGNWNVNTKVNCANTAVTLNGNITVTVTGWLNASNVVFTFNNSGRVGGNTYGTRVAGGGNLTLAHCTYQSNSPSQDTSSSGNSNTWIYTSSCYLVGSKDANMWFHGTLFKGIGMYPLSPSGIRIGGIGTCESNTWIDNCTCIDSVNCFYGASNLAGEHALRTLTNNFFQNVSTYPYWIGGGGPSYTLHIYNNRFGSGLNRLGTLITGGQNVELSGPNTFSSTPNYGFSFYENTHNITIHNLPINGSPTGIEINKANYNFDVHNVTLAGSGIGCNYGNHDIHIYNITKSAGGWLIASTAVLNQPNYRITVENVTYLKAGAPSIVGWAGENSTFKNIVANIPAFVAWDGTIGLSVRDLSDPVDYQKNVNYTNIFMTNFTTCVRPSYWTNVIIRDSKCTTPIFHAVDFITNNTNVKFINFTYTGVIEFDNNHDVFEYYNYLTVNAVGSLNFAVKVYNRTGGLLTTGSTTTGTKRLEVEEFRKTNLATTIVYPQTIKITGLVADTSYNISVNGVYQQSRSTNSTGGLSFQENITDNTNIRIKPTADIFPPFITVITPENTSYPHEALNAEVSLDENGDWCGYSLDGAANKTMNGSSRNWTAFLTELSQTQYRIKFWCNDSLGHRGSSNTVYFTIRECISDANCGIGEYCGSAFECLDKKSNGASCSGNVQCSSNACCHSVCRATCPYCGDGFCDSGLGETYVSCSLDCAGPPDGGGSPGGGSPGGGEPTTGGGSSGGGGAGGGMDINCFDNIMNQNETGVDCGGPCKACMSCTDGMQNQEETGVDCGGPCPSCAIIPGSCYDGIKNQGETGIDCGGPCGACRKVISLQEKFTLTTQVPSDVDGGAQYGVEVEIENTGDIELYELNVKVGDQNKKMRLDIGEKKTLAFYLTAPQQEGDYAVKVEVSGDKVNGQQQAKIHVKGTALVLRANTVDNVMYITTQTNYTGGLIELEVTKDGNLVYADFIQDKEHVTELQAGNYLVKASLRMDGKPIATKEITPIVEAEVEPDDMTIPILIPILLINVVLIVDIVKNITRRR